MGAGPISRFPLGLLDLFGVKQSGEYPRTIGGEFVPTLESLRMVAETNAVEVGPLSAISIAGVGTVAAGIRAAVGTLITEQNECALITHWGIHGTFVGVGAILPMATLAIIKQTSGIRFAFDTFRGSFVNGAATTREYAVGGNKLIYVPPGAEVWIQTNEDAVSVAGGNLSLSYSLRFIKMRI